MINQLGSFTWFLTFSFNDLVYSIPAILTLMGEKADDEVLANIAWFRKHELIKMDPVVSVRMFDRYVRKITVFLLEGKQVLGKAEANLGRVEFAGRGSPHLHMLLKIEGAPTADNPDKYSQEEICDYINEYVTTEYITEEKDKALNRLMKYQSHGHSKRCKPKNDSECAFGYPKPLSETTHFDEKEVKTKSKGGNAENSTKDEKARKYSKLRSLTIVYKRLPGSEFINTYSPLLLAAVRGNMDLQFCVSMWDLMHYVVSYTTKKEKDLFDSLREVIKNIEQPVNRASRDALRSIGNTFLNHRNVSIQEAIYRCLGNLKMSFFKPGVVFLESGQPEKRHGMLKPQKELDELPESSTDIFRTSPLERYKNRPESIESMSWAEFGSLYEGLYRPVTNVNRHKVIVLGNDLGRMIRREKPKVISFHRPSRHKEPEDYYYSRLCLYKPGWREEEDLIAQHPSYQSSFIAQFDQLKDNISKFEQYDEDMLKELIHDVTAEVRESLDNEEKQNEKLDPRFAFNHPPEDLKDPEQNNFNVTYKAAPISDEEYARITSSLNIKQKGLFEMIDTHSDLVAQGKPARQMIHFLSGAGGVGKSFLLKCIRGCISRKFENSLLHPPVAVAASTGVAASHVDGLTAHQLLQLDCQESGRINHKKLSEKKKNAMRKSFAHIRYILIDEVSMIGSGNLKQINARLNEIYGTPKAKFGGIHILFSGDLHQIPAVLQTMIFDLKDTDIARLGPNLWTDMVTFTELTDIVRTKGDDQFTAICHRLRVGEQTSDDIAVLQTRLLETPPTIDELMNNMVIYPTNAQCSTLNDRCITELAKTTKIVKIEAYDRFSNQQFNRSDFHNDHSNKDNKKKVASDYSTDDLNKTAGLPTTLQIASGARIMIRINIDTPDKIVNGVTGTVVNYMFRPGTSSDPRLICDARLVKQVNVKFDNPLVGDSIKHKCNNFCHADCILVGTVPIKPVEKEFKSKVNNSTWIKRYQLPFVLAWACSVHKVQGLSLEKAYIFLASVKKGHRFQAGQGYTAISRLTSLSGLNFIAFDPKQIKVSIKAKVEYARLRALPPFCPTPDPSDICPPCSPPSSGRKRSASAFSPTPANNCESCPQPKISKINHGTKYTSSVEPLLTDSASSREDFNKLPSDRVFTAATLQSHGHDILAEKLSSPVTVSTCPKSNESTTLRTDNCIPMNICLSSSPVPLLQRQFGINNSVSGQTIGKAYVIDFYDHPESKRTSELIKSLGFETKTVFANIQWGSSCGYIAARIIAMFKAQLNRGSDWFHLDVDEIMACNYPGPALAGIDMCEIGNFALNTSRPPQPVFLTETECLNLIVAYSQLYHNENHGERAQYLQNVRDPFSKSGFISHIKWVARKFNEQGRTTDHTFCICNTHNGRGLHWYVVAYKVESNNDDDNED